MQKRFYYIFGGTDNRGIIEYNCKPKDKEELIKLLDKLIVERGKNGDFNDIDTSEITDMSYLFVRRNPNELRWKKDEEDDEIDSSFNEENNILFDFNGDISNWDTSNVTTMKGMFMGVTSFNQDISVWDVRKVTDMSWMFRGATSFNREISSWDVNKVKNMDVMFSNAKAFNQDLSSWNVSNVTSKEYMFKGSGLEGNEPDWYK